MSRVHSRKGASRTSTSSMLAAMMRSVSAAEYVAISETPTSGLISVANRWQV